MTESACALWEGGGPSAEHGAVSKRAKHFSMVFLAQTACVAVGLWMENQYVKSSVRKAAEEQVWSDIEATVDHLQADLASVKLESPPTSMASSDGFRARLAGKRGFRVGAMIVDRDWCVVVAGYCPDQAAPAQLEAGQSIAWTPSREPTAETPATLRGIIDLPEGAHLAGARPLLGFKGFVVAYRPIAEIERASAALVSTLPALSGITLLWICASLTIVMYLVLTRFYEEVKRERKQTATETLRRTQNLVRTRDAVVFGLAKLADSRDPETGDHLERISMYSTMLASALKNHPRFRAEVTPAFVRLIGISSVLHDIGKVGVEDEILRKAEELTPEERIRMETHPTIGGNCLREIEQRLGSSNFLEMAREIALAHHERWDGTGYPERLSGEAIPLAARIVAIVDVYDALSSKRVYKPALPHDECLAIIRSQAGKHFDPDLVEVWLSLESRFREVADKYANVSATTAEPSPEETNAEPDDELPRKLLVSAVLAGQR